MGGVGLEVLLRFMGLLKKAFVNIDICQEVYLQKVWNVFSEEVSVLKNDSSDDHLCEW